MSINEIKTKSKRYESELLKEDILVYIYIFIYMRKHPFNTNILNGSSMLIEWHNLLEAS